MPEHILSEDDHVSKLDVRLWRRIFGHVRPYRKFVITLATMGVAFAGLETIMPRLVGAMLDEAVEAGGTNRLAWMGAAYGVGHVVMAVVIWAFIQSAGVVATGVGLDLRRKGFDRLQELSFSYFDVRPVGWLVTRLTSDVGKVSSLIPWFALDMAWGSCFICFIIIAMLLINWPLALVVMVIVPPLALASVWFQKRLLHSSRHMRKTNSMMTASYNECIMGVKTTKALVREEANLGDFQNLSGDMRLWSIRNALQSAVYLPLVVMLGSVGTGLALWKGGVDVRGATGMSLGSLVAFMQYAALFSMPIQELAARFTQLQSAQAAAERIQSLLDTEPQVKDTPDALEAMAIAEGTDSATIDGGDEHIEQIDFESVTFAYKPGETVLDTFDLTVRAGQTVALVGATGGGKSTIVNLLARFYEPTEGRVLLNGVDYRKRSLHWLQSNLGVVMQVPHLFSGTIRENIRYGRLDATDDEVEAAATLVNAHEFITESDDGYDTDVGEGGSRLSTGQRQLVALARAVIADPQIFIMDEATSSVDTETERLIQSAIETVLEGRIAFVIAHRLSTIQSADIIVVIDGGKIVEQGSHDELMAHGGRYHGLYTHHFVTETSARLLS